MPRAEPEAAAGALLAYGQEHAPWLLMWLLRLVTCCHSLSKPEVVLPQEDVILCYMLAAS